MANKEHLKILNKGVKTWNEWRLQNPNIQPNLKGTNLIKLDLRGINFRDADLSGAKLQGANFGLLIDGEVKPKGWYPQTILMNANFTGAKLSRAIFWITNVTNTNFTSADLIDAAFISLDFNGTDFTNASIGPTVFANCDFSMAKGLALVDHWLPSDIGIKTIYRSGGDMPTDFLRGAGVPETFIVYMNSLTVRAFEFYSCFISYSSKNHAFAERLYIDLQANGVRCWFAPEDLNIGDRTRVSIDESIRKYDKLLLILSRHSVQSEWVEKEVETAMEKERIQKRIVLFPIRLDNAILKVESGWAADIRRTRNIGDFTRWKTHDNYQKALIRLLHDLQADSTN